MVNFFWICFAPLVSLIYKLFSVPYCFTGISTRPDICFTCCQFMYGNCSVPNKYILNIYLLLLCPTARHIYIKIYFNTNFLNPMILKIMAIIYPIKEITGMSNTLGPKETTDEPIMSADTSAIIETLSVMSTSNLNCNSSLSILWIVLVRSFGSD